AGTESIHQRSIRSIPSIPLLTATDVTNTHPQILTVLPQGSQDTLDITQADLGYPVPTTSTRNSKKKAHAPLAPSAMMIGSLSLQRERGGSSLSSYQPQCLSQGKCERSLFVCANCGNVNI